MGLAIDVTDPFYAYRVQDAAEVERVKWLQKLRQSLLNNLATTTLQVIHSNSSTASTGTTQLPEDNTIPQNTEGFQVLTGSITPKSASSILLIDATIFCSSSVANSYLGVALFQDTTANALAATGVSPGVLESSNTIRLTHIMTSGTTSATTFKIRIGHAVAATVTFGGVGGTTIYGAIPHSSLIITEIGSI